MTAGEPGPARTLVVLRHAKSAYPPGVPDHDRPLSPRGVADARATGAWLRDRFPALDHVVVSSARRTRGTWTLVAAEVGYIGAAGYDVASPGPLTVDPRVYDATADELLTVLRELPDRVATAVLVGHNPGCEDLVRLLAGERDPDAAAALDVKYPTAGAAVLETRVPWAALAPGDARLAEFVVNRGEAAPPYG
ncbi:MAG: histidine phosphatase family protein [Frankiales bacterium]|nr:histidine phosphatase family protein [Frankiales bacterium]